MYLSHIFIARDINVKGNTLSKESSLVWHTVRGNFSQDVLDSTDPAEEEVEYVHIRPRCHDMHGECVSWSRRGECRRNPTYMQADCPLSCGTCESGTSRHGEL